jgi:hypothetical protein
LFLAQSWKGVINPRVAEPVAKPSRAKGKRKAAPLSHAAALKIELLNATADALSRAPKEYDPKRPKATIAVNGSLYTIRNTVEALSEFQSRLEKLQTTSKPPGVPRAALKLRL